MHYTLGDTINKTFTTRAFATGIPTTLAGTPVVSAYEDDSVTQITTGITLGVDHDSVTGLNLLTLVLTGGNGFEAGKDYNFVITTGTVGGVSVVGETVLSISLDRAPAFVRLGAPVGASVSADIADVPTVSELNARTLVAASYFDPAADAVANVTLVVTTTTNTDMRGTDNAALASVATEARLSELDEATSGKMANQIDIIQIDTTTDIPAQITALNNVSIADILASQLTESYAADGVAPTLSQAIFLIQQMLGDFSIAGTTLTVRKIDGAATAATFTLDSATAPTDITRIT